MENDYNDNYIKTDMDTTSNDDMIEIHSKDIIIKSEREKDLIYIIISCLIFLVTIVIPIILMIIYRLYDYIIPFFKTYLFIIIRHAWLVVIAAILFFPFKVYKIIKSWIIEIAITSSYVKNPLKHKDINKQYKEINFKKLKKVYFHVCRFWFLVKLIIYLVLFVMLLFVIFLICFMLGHTISWMDYFWILR